MVITIMGCTSKRGMIWAISGGDRKGKEKVLRVKRIKVYNSSTNIYE
jgi:hypothetical protein